MKTHSEVNFEKRGKLTDHQTCPVCQCCTCDGHTHAKLRTIFTLLAFLLSFLLLPFPTLAAETPYDFTPIHITIPGKPNAFVWLKDINKNGWILASTFWMEGNTPVWGSLIGKMNGRLNKLNQVEIFFTCTGVALNDSRRVVGNSAAGPCVRFPSGQVFTLAALPSATAFGISTDNRVTGQYITTAGEPHGFTWSAADGYGFIDIPALPGTKVQTVPIAAALSGQILISYDIQTLGNEGLEAGFLIYDNGTFSAPIALNSLVGGPYFQARDYNDNGIVPFLFTPNDGTPLRLKLYDEGIVDVTGWPAGWQLLFVEGIGNDDTFVGAFRVPTGPGTFQQYSFIASPVLAQLTKVLRHHTE